MGSVMTIGKFEICGNNVAINTSGEFLFCCTGVITCEDCLDSVIGSKIVIDFDGDGPTTNCGIFGATAIKLTSVRSTGTIAADTPGVSWTLGTDPITSDIIWPEAQQEGTGFSSYYSRVPVIENITLVCGVDGSGDPLINYTVNMGIAQSPNYATSGSPPSYDQWSVITSSIYNLDYNVSSDPYTGCDSSYTSTGTTPSTVWSYTGTLPIVLTNLTT